MNAATFFYRLFFTRDDDLDVLQVLFIMVVLATLACVWRVVQPGATDSVVASGMVTLRWMVGLLAVTAVPKWMTPMITAVLVSRAGQAAMTAQESHNYGNLWTDNETGDSAPVRNYRE